MKPVIYLDNHSTTRVDPRVVEAMLPTFDECYGNAGSITHSFGEHARDKVEQARTIIAESIGAVPNEIVFTSGATESNNLAIPGSCLRRKSNGHIITVETEHHAVLDPVRKLEKSGFSVTRLPVFQAGTQDVGQIDLEQLRDAITDETILVSVMLANNEIGVLQPLTEISRICQEHSVLLHSDATQAVGRMPVNVDDLGVDLMSFSAHKMYGPKGVGALFVRQRGRRVRLVSQIDGGGQERGLRSGTANVPGIVGFGKAIQLCNEEKGVEIERIKGLRNKLYTLLCEFLVDLPINGPAWNLELGSASNRLPGNLNCQFPGLDGQTLMMETPGLALSSGSACSSANPEPSHVLHAIGLNDDQIRSSLRFGIGRFTTEVEIKSAVEQLSSSALRLRSFSTERG